MTVSALPLRVPLEELERRIFELLEQHPDGITEYELIQQLRDDGVFDIAEGELLSADSLVMFRIHFTVYHCVYRLRIRLLNEQRHELLPGPLVIQLLPYRSGESTLAEHNTLQHYYLDLDNLESTKREDVEEMLARFWTRLENSEQREQALAELGLTDPVDDDTIRQTYRRLAMQHHPDRGGDKEKLQDINVAMGVLANGFKLSGE